MKTYYQAKAALCRQMAERPPLVRSAATLKRMADRFDALAAAVQAEQPAPEPLAAEPSA